MPFSSPLNHDPLWDGQPVSIGAATALNKAVIQKSAAVLIKYCFRRIIFRRHCM